MEIRRNENTEHIEKYLENLLSTEEKIAFENEIANNPGLEEEVKQHMLIRKAIIQKERIQLREKIKNWRKEEPDLSEPVKTKTIQIQRRVFIAAAIIAMGGLLIWLWKFNLEYNQNLALKFYEPDPDLISTTKDIRSVDPLRNGINYFVKGDLDNAILEFKKFPNNTKALYALGHIYFNMSQYDQAINFFEKTISKNSPEFIEKAEWYLLLSYLGNNHPDQAFINLLNKIISDGNFYSEKAQLLKQKI